MSSGILDYITWRGDLSLKQYPLNEIDALIFSELSYIKMNGIVSESFSRKGITLEQAAHDFFYAPDILERSDTGLFINNSLIELLRVMGNAPRYKNMQLCGFVESLDTAHEKQFAAITILPGDGTIFVAFRGTDDTIVGWKEDFNMAFITPVPSQKDALEYLTAAASKLPGKIRVGGHSKGGNLAVYAATFCQPKIQHRILNIYNHDGPGFQTNITDTPEFNAIRDKIQTYVPQTSIIGMLLAHHNTYTIIKSEESGIMQHDPFSWQLDGPHFIIQDKLTDQSILIDKTIRTWLEKLDNKQREDFVDALYRVLTSSDAATLRELSEKWTRNPAMALRAFLSLDENTRHIMWESLQLLFKSAAEHIPPLTEILFNKSRKKVNIEQKKNISKTAQKQLPGIKPQ